MKLTQVRIESFRSFKDETINLDNYNCFVGANGCGKSTFLMALNVFFRNSTPNANIFVLTQEDFHHKVTDRPVKITLTFEGLSAEAQEDFRQYYRQNKLIVSVIAQWDAVTQTAPVKQYGSRLGMECFAVFFAKYNDNAKVAELKEVYASIKQQKTDLPSASTKDAMHDALRAYEDAHSDQCVLKDSSDEFYGFTKGSDRLPKYVQWVYIPAVKDASTEQNEEKKTALGELLARTTRTVVNFKERIKVLKSELEDKYKEIIEAERPALSGLSQSLQERLRVWSHPGAMVKVDWHYDKDKTVIVTEPYARASVGEDQFIGEISRLGHGIQRSFLVALLQELTSSNDAAAPTLILGFEEPELYQHPPQARHMANILEELSTRNTQVMITTHSPYFVSSKGFENIRLIRKDLTTYTSKVTSVSLTKINQMIATALGSQPKTPSQLTADIEQIMQPSLKELFFTPAVVLVEGREDVAYVSTYLHLSNLWNDFRKYNCHFVVCEGKTNLSRPLAIAKGFGIPAFTIFDGDNDRAQSNEANIRDNKCIFALAEVSGNTASSSTIWTDNMTMWGSQIGKIIKTDYGDSTWDAAHAKVVAGNGWENSSNKNSLVIAATLEELWNQGKRSDILLKLCQTIINFGKKYSGM